MLSGSASKEGCRIAGSAKEAGEGGDLSRWRLILLVAVLSVLLAGVWVTSRPSPAYPGGEFGPLVLWAGAAVAAAGR